MRGKIASILWVLVLVLEAGALQAAERNVVLFVADDHGRDTGAYGNPVVRTPHLDALASDGVLFTHAFATTASCSASRSVILTGLYNHRTGQYGHQHDYNHFISFEDLLSLPVLLRQAGYRTASVGKYHVAPKSVYDFDLFFPGSERSPAEMVEKCRDFVSSQSEQPFFLYFCVSDPHRGGGVVEESPLKPDRFGNREEGYPGIATARYDPAEVIVPPFLPDTPAARAELAQYYQSISRLDQGFGHLVTLLKAAAVFEKTLIVYISDHGMAFPGAKTTAYEPGLGSPCIVRNPYSQRRGIRNDAMINWADLTPTILDFAGVPQPVYSSHVTIPMVRGELPERLGLHGRSFLGVLEEEHPKGWDETFASHTFHEIQMYYPMRVVRTRRYKLIWNIAHPLPFPFASDLWASETWQEVFRRGLKASYGVRTVDEYIHRPEFELYDLSTDPWESTNLSADPRYASVLGELKEKLRDFQRRTSDPWLSKWHYE